MALTASLMLDGGVWVAPGTHRATTNPGSAGGPDSGADIAPGRVVSAAAGDVIVLDSCLWHADDAVSTTEPHTRVEISYIPWWLNATALLPGLADYELSSAGDRSVEHVMLLSATAYESLPEDIRPLVRHLQSGQEIIHE